MDRAHLAQQAGTTHQNKHSQRCSKDSTQQNRSRDISHDSDALATNITPRVGHGGGRRFQRRDAETSRATRGDANRETQAIPRKTEKAITRPAMRCKLTKRTGKHSCAGIESAPLGERGGGGEEGECCMLRIASLAFYRKRASFALKVNFGWSGASLRGFFWFATKVLFCRCSFVKTRFLCDGCLL